MKIYRSNQRAKKSRKENVVCSLQKKLWACRESKMAFFPTNRVFPISSKNYYFEKFILQIKFSPFARKEDSTSFYETKFHKGQKTFVRHHNRHWCYQWLDCNEIQPLVDFPLKIMLIPWVQSFDFWIFRNTLKSPKLQATFFLDYSSVSPFLHKQFPSETLGDNTKMSLTSVQGMVIVSRVKYPNIL